ncbi:MAG TPA: cation:proton antiporter [Thermomicrobiales bacterium]|nr:cation:proton antiporter [Thermomicrobiales bacterium]
MDDANFLATLAIALIVALACVSLAIRLGQSAILGYIVGGVIISPHTPGFVGDQLAVDQMAEVGVILLMFTIGVQLSLRDLLRVGRIATVGGSIQVVLTIGIGALVGWLLGWGWLEALFFGAVISNSSSTVLSKVLAERGESGAVHGQIALAWSTIQDMSTIILVVVLTALAEGGDMLAVDLTWATLRAALFLALIGPVGIRVLPWLFERVAALRSREIFIISVAAFALGTAYAATFFGLSLALGAFVAGVVVSESDLSHQIIGEVTPLRDIFAGIFFISVGMLVDVGYVTTHLPLVLLAVALIVIAKGALVAALTLAFRYPVRTAALTGVALAQSAEFSFILARVGADINAVSAEIFSLMLAASAASIVVSPLLHRVAPPLIRQLERSMRGPALGRLPERGEDEPPPRGHAVLCGYGRVGHVIGSALRRRGFPIIVVEQDQRIVRQLRDEGVRALLGYAEHPSLIEQMHLETARVLIVAVPDALAARRIVDEALRINPRLHVVARTHSQEERDRLDQLGVEEAVVGELELAIEMTRFALHRFGVGTLETQAVLQRLRHQHQPARDARNALPRGRNRLRQRIANVGGRRPGRAPDADDDDVDAPEAASRRS